MDEPGSTGPISPERLPDEKLRATTGRRPRSCRRRSLPDFGGRGRPAVACPFPGLPSHIAILPWNRSVAESRNVGDWCRRLMPVPRPHCEARMAATSATGSRTRGPVGVTSARRLVPLKVNGAS